MSTEAQSALIGRYINYLSKSGKVKTGLVREFRFDIKRRTNVAWIEKTNSSLLSSKFVAVPINNILQPRFTNASTGGGRSQPDSRTNQVNVHSLDPHSFTYAGTVYRRTGHETFRIGEEVIWLLPREHRDPANPIIGKIEMIGRNDSGEFCAVVKFDEPTQHLPKYIQVEPRNRNIIALEDLLLLQSYTAALDSIDAVGSGDPTEESAATASAPTSQTDNEIDLISFESSATQLPSNELLSLNSEIRLDQLAASKESDKQLSQISHNAVKSSPAGFLLPVVYPTQGPGTQLPQSSYSVPTLSSGQSGFYQYNSFSKTPAFGQPPVPANSNNPFYQSPAVGNVMMNYQLSDKGQMTSPFGTGL